MPGLRLIKDSIIQETISGFNKRWEELEAGQAGLKQNLVLYNNFVKEKQGKVADGVSIILIEKKKQKKVCIALYSIYTTVRREQGCTNLYSWIRNV